MQPKDIKKVLIVGAGTMGQQIGTQCALHGFDVVMVDVDSKILENALSRMEKLLGFFVKCQTITPETAQTAQNRLTATTDLDRAAADADLVSESAPEDAELKGRLFAQLDKVCPAHTIFTTNTSTLLPSEIAERTGRPEKFTALHFHDTRTTNIVDVMPHPGTSPETTQIVIKFAERIGQSPIVLKKENSGYIFNAMLSAWLNAAQTLAANGVADIEDIDRVWMGILNMPMGPFAMMDSIGLETVWKVADNTAKKHHDPQLVKNAEFIKSYINKGMLGQKSGQGFYSYPNPAFKPRDFIKRNGET